MSDDVTYSTFSSENSYGQNKRYFYKSTRVNVKISGVC